MKDELEGILSNRVKFIGDGEWTLLGTPNDVIKELEALINKQIIEAKIEERNRLLDWNCDEVHDAIRSAVKDYGSIKLIVAGKESVFDLTGVISTSVQDKLDKLRTTK